MPLQVYSLDVTTDAAGAGTATTRRIRGEVVAFRAPNAATAILAGTSDWSLVDSHNGATILSVSNVGAPFEYHPAVPLHTSTGGTSGTATTVGYPVGGTVTFTIASGPPSASGTAFLYLRT